MVSPLPGHPLREKMSATNMAQRRPEKSLLQAVTGREKGTSVRNPESFDKALSPQPLSGHLQGYRVWKRLPRSRCRCRSEGRIVAGTAVPVSGDAAIA